MSLAMRIIKARKSGALHSQLGARFGQAGITRFQGPMMYSRARAGQGGGWFGDLLGNVVGAIPVVGGVLKAGVGAVDKALSKKKSVAGTSAPTFAAPQTSGPGFSGGPIPALPPLSGGGSFGPDIPLSTGSGTDVVPYKGCAPSGYHPNKSGYWKNQSGMLPGASWVEPGSILVRNRKRNPFNPKAASRAMSRLASLSQGMRVLEKQLTKLAPRKRASCAGRCSSKRK